MSILLQASALLAHLRIARWRPEGGWESARVDSRGLLRGVAAAPGKSRVWPQQSLLELAALLFAGRPGEIAGRGEARRSARSLVRTCRQQLVPVAPDDLVRQLFESAGFLWESAFSSARSALAGEHLAGGRIHLWVAGPGWFRRRLLRGGGSLGDLRRRLETSDLRSVWSRAAGTSGPRSVERARDLLAEGRCRPALTLLEGVPGGASEALGVVTRARLGRLEAARRALARLEPDSLAEDDLAEVAESAVAVHSKLGRSRAAGPWVARALASTTGSARRRAWLTAASYARDRGDFQEMDRCLGRARPRGNESGLVWRWRQAAGLGALAKQEPAAACRQFARAVLESRRQLGRFEAAALWNDLAVARAELGDLAGAERALVHSVRLHDRSDSPIGTTLALFNLAELRLRRGRLEGVREILDRSTRLNLESGNWRGLAYDRELGVRYELVRGRPARALERARTALAELDRRLLDGRRGALQALAARALGWLGRPAEAADALFRSAPRPPEHAGAELYRAVFDPEELPALWALAGDRTRALSSAPDGPGGGVWSAALAEREPQAWNWAELEKLEPYRAARLIADLELVSPGMPPRDRLLGALGTLRRIGNDFLAHRLERALEGPWAALAHYLEGAPDRGEGLAELIDRAGYPDAELVWRLRGVDRVIVDGKGGAEERRAELGTGCLVLRAERIDGALEALFALAARDFRPPASSSESSAAAVVGRSPALRAALERARRLAARDVPILIQGETGTGKELVARYVHESSPRQGGRLVPLNSAALSESLVLSDLFGHVRGAFTGAERDRAGIFETARGGTVLLDEIGDLPFEAQGMLLRVLQEGEVRRLGESRVRRVDARVVAATHRDLDRLVAEGRFREDLYYRLAVGRVELPPLRERGADLELLTRHFLDRCGGGQRLTLSAGAMDRLRAHRWPGNVRELANTLAVAVALCEGGIVRAGHLPLPAAETAVGGYHQRVLDFRRRLVREALEESQGNRAAAARRLGMSRQALSYLVRALRIG